MNEKGSPGTSEKGSSLGPLPTHDVVHMDVPMDVHNVVHNMDGPRCQLYRSASIMYMDTYAPRISYHGHAASAAAAGVIHGSTAVLLLTSCSSSSPVRSRARLA